MGLKRLILCLSELILGLREFILDLRGLILCLGGLILDPERAELGPKRAYMGPEGGWSSLGGRTDGQMDGWTSGNSPLCPTGHRPFGAAAQKARYMTCNSHDRSSRVSKAQK